MVIEDQQGRVFGIEVKACATVRSADLRELRQLQAAVGDKFVQGLVLHGHDRITPFDARLHAGSVSLLWSSAMRAGANSSWPGKSPQFSPHAAPKKQQG